VLGFLVHQEYNVLDYEDRVVDGFYDVFGLSTDSANQGKMPCLTDLETNLGSSGFEVVMVNRTIDPALEELLQIAHCIALDCPVAEFDVLAKRLAELVNGHMGGPVKNAEIMSARWMERRTELRTSLPTSVLPCFSRSAIGLSLLTLGSIGNIFWICFLCLYWLLKFQAKFGIFHLMSGYKIIWVLSPPKTSTP
jgi:hypothetical protein